MLRIKCGASAPPSMSTYWCTATAQAARTRCSRSEPAPSTMKRVPNGTKCLDSTTRVTAMELTRNSCSSCTTTTASPDTTSTRLTIWARLTLCWPQISQTATTCSRSRCHWKTRRDICLWKSPNMAANRKQRRNTYKHCLSKRRSTMATV